jgi:hypothetical protein
MDLSVEQLVSNILAGQTFRVTPIMITSDECKKWVRLRKNPDRFLPTVFDGDWANIDAHPEAGTHRAISVVLCNDGIGRAVIRSGKFLYAYPWIA